MNEYHLYYSSRSDDEIAKRVGSKRRELVEVFSKTAFQTDVDPVRVAVLGCADRRFVGAHKKLFEETLQAPVELTTFDIEREHLEGEHGVVQHDITLPLPGGLFDITFAHIVLKFIDSKKHLQVIQNAYDSLRAPGMAIFVNDDTKSYPGAFVYKKADRFQVDLYTIKEWLRERSIDYVDWHFTVRGIEQVAIEGDMLVLIKK
jgi:hypothetical protein